MIVRPAVRSDAGRIAALRAASWSAAYKDLLPPAVLEATTSDPRMPTLYAEAIDDAPGQRRSFFVAEVDGALTGYASAGPVREPDLDAHTTGELYALYTHPDAWGSGTGLALQRTALSFLLGQGYAGAAVRVFTANGRARRFYAKTGWTFEGDEQVSRRWLVPEVRYRRTLTTGEAVID